MNNYNLNSIVSNSEQEALKEMIFKRARERAQSFTEEIQSSYTTAIQNDVMEIARETFAASKNPFAQLQETPKTEDKTENNIEKSPEIGFAQKQVKDIKTQIENKNKSTTLEIVNKEVEQAMINARVDLSKKTSFMGALNFLNSQASIALIKNKGQAFEAVV